jgi:hypothetical protein
MKAATKDQVLGTWIELAAPVKAAGGPDSVPEAPTPDAPPVALELTPVVPTPPPTVVPTPPPTVVPTPPPTVVPTPPPPTVAPELAPAPDAPAVAEVVAPEAPDDEPPEAGLTVAALDATRGVEEDASGADPLVFDGEFTVGEGAELATGCGVELTLSACAGAALAAPALLNL